MRKYVIVLASAATLVITGAATKAAYFSGHPAQTSGAAVGVEDDLRELRLLLRSLADPGDASGVLAVLTGLFFGIDLESLEAGSSKQGRIDLTIFPLPQPGFDIAADRDDLKVWP